MKKMLLFAILVGMCFSMAWISLPHAKGADPGLVGYWKFDNGSGTVAADNSGNGNTGTVHGAQWVAGINGTALSFDGVSSYVSVSDSPSLDISGNQISIEFWMKPTVNFPYNSTNIIIFDKGNAYTAAIELETGPGTGRLLSNLPFFGSVDSTTNFWASGTWYHIAITYDGSNMRIYVNGQLENTVPTTGNVQSSTYPLSIGSYTSGTQNFFKGILDEFAIYNYARTAGQIAADAHAFLRNIALSPYTGFASTTITGSEFSNNSKVTITWDGTTIPSVPSSVITDTTGSFAALISVPTQTAPGVHTINATDESGDWATAAFTVIDMTGPQGSAGLQGLQGPKGDKGDVGPAGSPGENQLVLIAFPTAASIFALCIAVVALLRRKP